MKSYFGKTSFNVDAIISYAELVAEENANIQKGMNFNINPEYSIFLMSVSKKAPYKDEFDEVTGTIIYEGHDEPRNISKTPKKVDQQLITSKGSLTENGKFFTAAQAYKMKLIEHPHKVKVYEKIYAGIWCYKGFFNLIDVKMVNTGERKVFKFYLQPVELKPFHKEIIIPHSRLIPSHVKIDVWARDNGPIFLDMPRPSHVARAVTLSMS